MNILKMMLVVFVSMAAVSAYLIPLKPEVKVVKITYESVPSGATIISMHGRIVGTTPITAYYPVSSKALIYGGFI